jgi:hypothetical protein
VSIATQWQGLLQRKSEQIMTRVDRSAIFFAEHQGVEFFFFKDESVLDSLGETWTKAEWQSRFGELVCDDCGAKPVFATGTATLDTVMYAVPGMDDASN